MEKIIIYSVVAGALFGIWPILLVKSQINPLVGSAVVCLMTFATVLYFAKSNLIPTFENLRTSQTPWAIPVFLVLSAGIGNSIAWFFYQKLFSAANPGIYITIATAAIPVFTYIASAVIMRQRVTKTELLGLTLAVVGIWFLSPKK